jgi:hypothetical protein
MKDVKSLVQNFQQGQIQPQGQHQLQNNIPPVVKQLVDQVFKQLKVICPAYEHSLPTEQAVNDCKKEWVKAFYENNINQVELVKAGLAGVRRSDSDFLPSCGKFISWCKPSPEDMGWPSVQDALKQCIKHRANQKMFRPQNIYIRPMIIELCKTVDWWQMNNDSNAQQRKLADKHFTDKYMELLNSGYQEPIESEVERLPTEEKVKEGMSEQQKLDQQKRSQAYIDQIKANLKKSRGKQNG